MGMLAERNFVPPKSLTTEELDHMFHTMAKKYEEAYKRLNDEIFEEVAGTKRVPFACSRALHACF